MLFIHTPRVMRDRHLKHGLGEVNGDRCMLHLDSSSAVARRGRFTTGTMMPHQREESIPSLVQDCPDSARVVVADQLARSTLLADNLRVKSKVHPKYKTKYHGGNWPEYEQALVRRGDVTLWLSAEAMDAWRPAPSGRPGGPRKFSDVSIMTALMLRLVFRLPLRQTEGFLRSVLALMRTDLEAPDHTPLSRRSQHLDLALDRIPAQRPVHLIVDSTGLSIVGKGEWAAVKHGNRGKRGWKKLHFGVDRSGVIVAQAVTEPTADDATTGISLIEQVDGDIASVTADVAYDTIAFYEAAWARGARVVVPPAKTASVSRRRPRSGARDRTITRVKRLGRRRWKGHAADDGPRARRRASTGGPGVRPRRARARVVSVAAVLVGAGVWAVARSKD